MMQIDGHKIYQDRFSRCFLIPDKLFNDFLDYQNRLDKLDKHSEEFEELDIEFFDKFQDYCQS